MTAMSNQQTEEAFLASKGAGSYLGHGANRAKGASRAPEANRGQRGQIAGIGGESRAVGANHAKKTFYHVLLL